MIIVFFKQQLQAICSLLFRNKTSGAVSKKLPKSKTINDEAPFLE